MPVLTAVLAGLLSVSSCWNLYDAAMGQSAQAAHPRFVSYDERIDIQAHGAQLVKEIAHIDYRDDGLALILDDRYGQGPVLTKRLDPGPPVLGPYGTARAGWANRDGWPQLRTVADVRVRGAESCENGGLVAGAGGMPAYHLLFHRADPSSPGLKELWIDVQTGAIQRVIFTGFLRFAGMGGLRSTDFVLDLTQVDGYSVISHIAWSLSGISGDYTLEHFSFPGNIAAIP